MANQVQRVQDALRRLDAIERVYRDEASKAGDGEWAARCKGTARGIDMAVREIREALKHSESAIAKWGP
jgi:hypothetical protein